MTQPDSAHLVELDGTGWATWRDVVLRSAGFPADAVDALRDRELAAAADAATRDPGQLAAYRREHAAAGDRLAVAMRAVAQSPSRPRSAKRSPGRTLSWSRAAWTRWARDGPAPPGRGATS